jgi:hypothetical protein
MTRIAIATSDGVSVCDHLARSGNHAAFVSMLNGCDAVICGGIGEGAAVSTEGRLATSDERVCLCSH